MNSWQEKPRQSRTRKATSDAEFVNEIVSGKLLRDTAPVKTEGFLVFRRPYGNSSLVSRWFTAGGLLTVLMQGARRSKNPFQGNTDILCFSEIIYFHKPSSQLPIMQEATLLGSLDAFQMNLSRLTHASMLAEITAKLGSEQQDCSTAFLSLKRACEDFLDPARDLRSLTSLTLQLLGNQGMATSFDSCGSCRNSFKTGERSATTSQAAAIWCLKCAAKFQTEYILPGDIRTYLANLQHNPKADVPPLSVRDRKLTAKVLFNWIEFQIGWPLRSRTTFQTT